MRVALLQWMNNKIYHYKFTMKTFWGPFGSLAVGNKSFLLGKQIRSQCNLQLITAKSWYSKIWLWSSPETIRNCWKIEVSYLGHGRILFCFFLTPLGKHQVPLLLIHPSALSNKSKVSWNRIESLFMKALECMGCQSQKKNQISENRTNGYPSIKFILNVIYVFKLFTKIMLKT